MSYTLNVRTNNIIKNLKFEQNKKINTTSSTINWMRHLIPQQEINQSLTDLLIEKEKDLPNVLRLFEDKKNISDFVNSSPQTIDSNPLKKKIKPEYLFSPLVLEKIYKLRDIFLHFDKDRSRTLEISELCAMFNSNNIPITKNELIDLFTLQGEQKRKSWQYKLTFLDFVKFCLDEQCQEKYRILITKIKQRSKKTLHIPLSLQQTLEYISNQTQIQRCYNKIHKGIKKIEKIKVSKKHLSTKSLKNNLLYKIGFERGVNSGMVCKAFYDIVEINKHKLTNLEKESKKSSLNINKSETKTYNLHTNIKDKKSSVCQTTLDSIHGKGISLQTHSHQRNNLPYFGKHSIYESSLPCLSMSQRGLENIYKSPTAVLKNGRNKKIFDSYFGNNQVHTEINNGTFFNYIRNSPGYFNRYKFMRTSLIRRYKTNLLN